MTDTFTNTNSEEFQQELSSLQRHTYEKLYAFNFDLTEEQLYSDYRSELERSLSRKNIEISSELLQRPDAAFCKQIQEKNASVRQRMESLFKDNVLLTYSMTHDYQEPEYANNASVIQWGLEDKCQKLASSVAPLALENDCDCALFSDGKMFVSEYVTKAYVERMSKIAKKYIENEIVVEEIDREDIAWINAYARFLYQDKNYVKRLQPLEDFLFELFDQESVCLTASNNIIIHPEVRNCMALFDNGRLIVSKEAYMMPASKRIISKTCLSFSKSRVIFEKEVVPQAYFEEIYRQAQKKAWYLNEEEQLQSYEVFQAKNRLKEMGLSEDETIEMNRFVSELMNENTCLTVKPAEPFDTLDREKIAFFQDGSLIINQAYKNEAFVLSFEALACRKFPELEIKKHSVPSAYLKAIYAHFPLEEREHKEKVLEVLKKQAKRIVRSEDIPHHEALEVVAVSNFFKNWKEVTQMSQDKAAFLLQCFDKKEEKMPLATIYSRNIMNKEDKTFEEAQEILAKKLGFKSWARVDALSLEEFDDLLSNFKE